MSVPSLAGLRIGAVSYLNTKPLIDALSGPVVLDVPAVLARDFYAGELDVALLPFFAVLRAGGGRLVDDVAIACRGDVYSVFVAAKGPFKDCREIYLDPSSRSSAALLRTLLAEFYPGGPRIVEAAEIPENAAHLLIGNPAIEFRKQMGAGWRYHDLGGLWHRHTGLPFVFAVWAVKEPVDPLVGRLFRDLKTVGLERRPEIAAREADPEFAFRYLKEFIRYDIGVDEKRAMALFEELARRHGVLSGDTPAAITWC